jgi:S-DNA-T family DNA segregation ATPase FtsK/SpoIIIE
MHERMVKKRSAWLSPAVSHFIKRRLAELFGLCWLSLAAMLVLSLLSYDPFDPSWNVAIDGHVQNWMGARGAIVADILYQTFGGLSYGVAAVIGLWGMFFFMGRFLRWFWLRPILLSVTLVGIGVACHLLSLPFSVGFVSLLLSKKIIQTFPHLLLSQQMTVVMTVGLVIAVSGLFVLAGFSFRDIKQVMHVMGRMGRLFVTLFQRRSPPSSSLPSFSVSVSHRSDVRPTLHERVERLARLTTFFSTVFSKLRSLLPTESLAERREARLNLNRSQEPHLGLYQQEQHQHGRHQQEESHQEERPSHFSSKEHRTTEQPDRVQANYSASDDHVIQSDRVERPLTGRCESISLAETGGVVSQSAGPLHQTSAHHKSPVLDLAVETIYQLPPLELLNQPLIVRDELEENDKQLQDNARQLMTVLEDFGVKGHIMKVRPGPVVTLYELVPAAGIKSSRVIGLADDIARSMCALSARIAVIPGQNALGIELPNKSRQMVFLRELISHSYFDNPSLKLALALGKDISGAPVITDLARMPHLLVAGTTGSGKSVAINTMILSLLYRLSPDRCRFIMIDPKMLELSIYDGIPHLLAPVVTDPKKAIYALKWTVREMEDRYRAMSRLGVRNIEGYNMRLQEARQRGEVLTRQVQTGFDPETGQAIYETQPLNMELFPYIVVVVDEMADLMMVAGKEIEAAVQRLAQMARAAGIHLIMATQRPSVDVITGTIKANFPTRISFQVTSKFDSRTILGEQGAEQLLGRGDMLFMEPGGKIQRVHGPFATDSEVEQVVRYLKQQGAPAYIDTITEDVADTPLETFDSSEEGRGDQLYQQAVALVQREGKASTSFIQRHLQIGYNRAARIIEQMETEGIISAANHVGKREVLVRAS